MFLRIDRVFLLSISLVFCLTVNAQTDTQVKNAALEYARQYCSNAEEIIQQESADLVSFYMDGSTDFDLGSFGTTVHEGLHGYDGELSSKSTSELFRKGEYDKRIKAYFVNSDLILRPAQYKIFKTSTLHDSYFPQEVKDMFRYATYIMETGDDVSNENSKMTKDELRAYGVEELRNGEARSTSNVKGFYGLLEEFNAYHHGLKAMLEVLEKSDIDLGFSSTNSQTAYYEFNTFMAYYLKYAKEKRRDTYDLLMKEHELRVAYTLIELSWREVLTKLAEHEPSRNYFAIWKGEYDVFNEDLRKTMEVFMLSESELGEYAEYAKSKDYDMDFAEKSFRDLVAEREKGWGDNDSFEWDGDWGDDSDWDDDWDSNNSRSISIEIESKETGYHYVVIASVSSMMKAMSELLDLGSSESEFGIFQDGQNTYHVFLGKFKDKQKALSLSKNLKSKYPDVKVL